MLTDIVVDTNVFVHASNPVVTYCAEAKILLTALKNGTTLLCIDEGYNEDPARNQSLIGGEYQENIKPIMLAHAIIAELASTLRIKQVPKRVQPAIAKKINQNIPIPRDKTFLKVAINSENHFLCSHDFEHFPPKKRTKIKGLLNVHIKAAGETLPFLKKASG